MKNNLIKKISKQKINLTLLLIFLIIFISSAIKILSYKIRPVHHDEAVYNFFSKKILDKTYTYDPEYHGPLMFMVQAITIKIFGDNINGLRLSYLIFSILTIALLFILKNDFSQKRFLALIIFFSFSPIINFYSSYACWESGFLFFYVLFLISLIKILRGKTDFVFILAASSAIMVCIYESAIIIIFLTLLFSITFFKREIKKILKDKKQKNAFILKLFFALLLFATIVLLFFSVNFKQNPIQNILKMINYNLKKTHTTGHNKPFYYYIIKILPLELPIFLLFIYSFAIHLKFFLKDKNSLKDKKLRENTIIFLISITIFILLSIMPYKVPWLSFLYLPPILFFSTTAFEFEHDKKTEFLIKLLLIFTALFLLIITTRLNFYDYDNVKNPLAYVQSTREVPKIVDEVLKKNPSRGLIISSEYWPLPWYFRNITVDYYSKIPEYKINYEIYDFIITDKETFKNISNEDFIKNLSIKAFEIRPYVKLYLIFKI